MRKAKESQKWELIGVRYLRKERLVHTHHEISDGWDEDDLARLGKYLYSITVYDIITRYVERVPYITLGVFRKGREYRVEWAKCNPKDTFSKKEGRRIIQERADSAETYTSVNLATLPEYLVEKGLPDRYIKEAVDAITRIIQHDSYSKVRDKVNG